jgi:myo-inositol-1-phosphate synthase
VIDAIRCAKLALDRKIAGALIGPSGYYMKSPPVQFTDEEARRLTAEFIDKHNVMEQMAQINGTNQMAAAVGPPTKAND